jgi:hypothetical protein
MQSCTFSNKKNKKKLELIKFDLTCIKCSNYIAKRHRNIIKESDLGAHSNHG